MSSAFEGDGPFRFEIEDYALSKFTDKCFDSPEYAMIQAETGSPNDAHLRVSLAPLPKSFWPAPFYLMNVMTTDGQTRR